MPVHVDHDAGRLCLPVTRQDPRLSAGGDRPGLRGGDRAAIGNDACADHVLLHEAPQTLDYELATLARRRAPRTSAGSDRTALARGRSVRAVRGWIDLWRQPDHDRDESRSPVPSRQPAASGYRVLQ